MARHDGQDSGEKRTSRLRQSIAGFGLGGVKKLKEGVKAEVIGIFDVADSRKQTVVEDIIEGSSPRFLYYALMCISALIAGIGLLFNSPAVVIGAMLISPLMTPIFGISLGLIRGNFGLVRTALASEVGGIAVAMFAAFLLGSLPVPYIVTSEMLARTEPTLFDLGVATLAGIAGCIAMIDERISPVLPGIAIATSLTPPLATSGLCLALGAYHGAWGAFLLFFANFLAILIVSASVFIVAGFVKKLEMGSSVTVLKRFALTGVALVFVCVLLTKTLLGIVEETKTRNQIEAVFSSELYQEPGAYLERMLFKKRKESIDILAVVATPQVLSTKMISAIEKTIAEKLNFTTRLIVRCEIVKDVSATGSSVAVVDQNLDGEFITSELDPRVKRFQLGEQALREIVDEYPGLYLVDYDLIELEQGPIALATVEGPRVIPQKAVAEVEKILQQRLNDPALRLMVRTDSLMSMTGKGRVLYGNAHFGVSDPEYLAEQQRLEALAKEEIQRNKNTFVLNVDAVKSGDQWRIMAETVGPSALTPQQLKAAEDNVAKAAQTPVKLTAWSKVEIMVTGDSYVPVSEFAERERKETGLLEGDTVDD